MGYRIYQYEFLEPDKPAGVSGSSRALEDGLEREVEIYWWEPDKLSFAAASHKMENCSQKIRELGASVFSEGRRLYLAAPEPQTAESALALLQENSLFPGLQPLKSVAESAKTEDPQSGDVQPPNDVTPSTADPQSTASESVHTSGWAIAALFGLFVALFAVTIYWAVRGGDSPPPIRRPARPMRVGVFLSPENMPALGLHPDDGTSIDVVPLQNIDSILKEEDEQHPGFDIVAVPFTAVAETVGLQRRWRLVWLPDRSGLERVLIPSKNARDGDVALLRGEAAAVRFTAAAAALRSHLRELLPNNPKEPLRDPIRKYFDTADDLMEAELSRSRRDDDRRHVAVALPYPFASILEKRSDFVVAQFVPEPPPILRTSALLATRDAISKRAGEIANFVIKLGEAREYNRATASPQRPDDLQQFIKELKIPAPLWESRVDDLKSAKTEAWRQALQGSEPVPAQEAIDFMYGRSGRGCSEMKATPDLLTPGHLCSLIDDQVLLGIYEREAENPTPDLGGIVPALQEVCKSERVTKETWLHHMPDFESGEYAIKKAHWSADWESFAQSLKNDPRAYCVIGYTDATGREADNEKLGLDRAAEVKNRLKARAPNAHIIPVSGGALHTSESDAQKRRVEIKSLEVLAGQ